MDQLQLPLPPDPVELPWQRSRIRVPREDGGLLAIPELREVPDAAFRNRDFLAQAVGLEHPLIPADVTSFAPDDQSLPAQGDCRILGESLGRLRSQARSEALAAAARYTSRMLGRDIDAACSGPLIATGHQPDLFHPGVWVKQFAVSELARRTTGVGLNLIVDSDMMRSHRIRVPTGTRSQPATDWIPFDAPQSGPWQDVQIADRDCFESFGRRVTEAMSCWNISPLVTELWPHAVAHARVEPKLAECLSAARIRTEWNWGEGNLELPLSELCSTNAFLWFAVDLLSRADQFRTTYNDVLNEYRAVNRIRSESHPVPELAQVAGWTESPFLVWESGDARRSHVFQRRVGDELQLASSPQEDDVFGCLPFGTDGDPSDAVTALRHIQSLGYRFRTRALTTTLFTRLCLADLFVHGIGGAKYDEITDRIIARFYGIHPPAFLTLSATAWLPLAEPFSETADDVRRINSMRRELQHNPQRFIHANADASVASLIEEKQRLIAEQHAATVHPAAVPTDRQSGMTRYRRIPEINRELSQYTTKHRQQLMHELSDIEQRLHANAILTGREYSFCLYPAERMRRMTTELQAAFEF